MSNNLLTVFQHKVWRQLVIGVALLTGLVGGASFLQSIPEAHAASNCLYYTVQFGDTLSYIAGIYHSDVRSIGFANDIPNVNLIFPGQRFCIPVSRATAPVQRVISPAQPIVTTASGSATNLIRGIFGIYAEGAIRVARCESGLNPGAYNPISVGGSHAEGLFQILYPGTWLGTSQSSNSPYNARANVVAAYEIFSRDGYSWREWACKP